MRLIDADALLNELGMESECKRCLHFDGDLCMMGPQMMTVCSRIEEAPTVQNTGIWLPIRKGQKGYSAGDFKCSVCGRANPCYCVTLYCPWCGAKMNKEKSKHEK